MIQCRTLLLLHPVFSPGLLNEYPTALLRLQDVRAAGGERLQRVAVHVLLQERLPLHHAHHLPRRHDRPDGISLPGK